MIGIVSYNHICVSSHPLCGRSEKVLEGETTLRPKVRMIVKIFGSEGQRSLEKVGEGWVFLGDILEMFRRYLAKVGDEDVVKSAPKQGRITRSLSE